MNSEVKNCQNCKNPFTIEPEDFVAYEKFGVPPPKMCPLCRAQRRLLFRNERAFYKRKCDQCKRDIVSMYSANKPYPVWCNECWFSDTWDARAFGKTYDSSRPFFEQFNELWNKVPKVALIYVRSENSDYVNISADNKNCYMIVESSNNENCTHCYWIQVCRDSVDVSFSHKTELSYESDDCYNSSRLRYCKGCYDCLDSFFLLDCRGCTNCIGCVNLRNKQYCAFNKQLTKEAYREFLLSARLDTDSGVAALREKFEKFANSQIRKFAEIYNSANSSGNYIANAKNCRQCFHAYDAEDNAYSVHVWRGAKGIMDCDTSGRGAEHNYNSLNAGLAASYNICTSVCWGSAFAEYSCYCQNCTNVFGSVGLRKANYCILNREYSKEEYERLRKEITENIGGEIGHGEFFPPSLSAFGYNESAANEQFPLTKEKALAIGYQWEDHPRGTYGKETVSWDKVPDSIREVGEWDPLKEIFACTACKKNFRLIPDELQFYKRLEIPLPRLCPDCRHERRFIARGPNRLWHRNCQCTGNKSEMRSTKSETELRYTNTTAHFHDENPCPNEFETSYAPDRSEIVYCEQCYNAEIA